MATPDQVLPVEIAAIWKHIMERYKPGSRLPTEPELAKELKISRYKLRDGLRFLESFGAIERRPRLGTTVKALDSLLLSRKLLDMMEETLPSEVQEGGKEFDLIREARATVEGAVAFLATINRTPNDLGAMLTAIAQMEFVRVKVETQGTLQDEDLDAWIAADKAFHEAVLLATHNSHLFLFGRVIVASFAAKKPPKEICTGKIAEKIIDEHKAIYQHVLKGITITDPKNPKLENALQAAVEMFRHILVPKEEALPLGDHLRVWGQAPSEPSARTRRKKGEE